MFWEDHMDKRMILAIDDEEHILELIQYNLEANGFDVVTATSIAEAHKQLENHEIELILLDIMLPDMDGMTALRGFRTKEETKYIPIIMVTAKAEEIDKILGLELGADDYITKPFSVRELVARVKALVRREYRQPKVEVKNKLVFKGLELDLDSHKASCEQDLIELTLKEFELLKLFLQNQGKVFKREDLLDKIWGYDYYGETRTVDVHIRYLRSKLEKYGLEDSIETVRGVGYRFVKE